MQYRLETHSSICTNYISNGPSSISWLKFQLFCYEDTKPIIWQEFPFKITELPNTAAVLEWFYARRVTWAFLIIGGAKNHFQAIVWSLLTKRAQKMLQFAKLSSGSRFHNLTFFWLMLQRYRLLKVFLDGISFTTLTSISFRCLPTHPDK